MTTNSSRPPQPADVIEYSYLWRREAAEGREEGVKSRPCVVLAVEQQGEQLYVYVAPVTSKSPGVDGVEVPPAMAERIGLSMVPCWVILNETNRFAWPGPDLRPVASPRGLFCRYGAVSGNFHEFVAREHLKRRAHIVARTE